MAELPRDLSFDELKNIVKKAFLAEPLGKLGVEGEVSPYRAMLGRSNIVDYARQVLPDKLENTNWYANLQNNLPDADLNSVSGARRRVANQIGQIPLGGYHPRELERLQKLRTDSPLNVDQYVDAQKVPLL